MLKLKLQSTDKSIELNAPRITVGRDHENQLVLDADDVSGYHAEFHADNGKVYLVDLGSANGTFVNGQRVTQRQEINVWDEVKFGQVAAEVIDPSRRRPTKLNAAISDEQLAQAAQSGLAQGGDGLPRKATQLRAAVPDWSLTTPDGKIIPITSTLQVGSEAPCDILITDGMVSRRHAVIKVESNQLVVKDLNSSNGTFVNGKKITEQTLKPGDEVRFDAIPYKVNGVAEPQRSDSRVTQLRAAVDPTRTQQRAAVTETQTTGQSGTRVTPSLAPKLDVKDGLSAPKSITLTDNSYSIGRTSVCDVMLDNDSVSTDHASITAEGADWALTDKGSTNGTFVNSKRLAQGNKVVLKAGDKIKFGEVEALFSDPSATRTATRQMAAVPDRQRKPLPAWAYGVIGFAVVAVGMGVFLFKDKLRGGLPGMAPAQIEAKLQAGNTWSVRLPQHHGVLATPALGDINQDGFLDVVVADQKGFVTALDGQEGKEIYQAQIADSITASVTMGDLTGDDQPDVVVASDAGIVTALDSRGQFLWKSDAKLNLGAIYNKPALADVDNDGQMDVIVPSRNKGLVALNGNRGWNIWDTEAMTKGAVIGSPLKADINGDGVNDFVSVTDQGQVMAVSAQNGKAWQLWEQTVPKIKYASPVMVDLGEQSLVVVATANQGVFALDGASGRNVWSGLSGQNFFASPVVADTNGDEQPEIVFTAENGNTFVLDARYGEDLNSSNISGRFYATPALYDTNGDGIAELFMVSKQGSFMITETFRLRPELSVNVPEANDFSASAVLGDINNDALLDIVMASASGQITAYSINRKSPEGEVVWGEFLGNPN